MKIVIPGDIVSRAAAMRANGMFWKHIAQALGYGIDPLRRRVDPAYAEYRNEQKRANKAGYSFRGLQEEGAPDRPLTPDEWRAWKLKPQPIDDRSLTARLMGDPPPWRSAAFAGQDPPVDSPFSRGERGTTPSSAEILPVKSNGVARSVERQ